MNGDKEPVIADVWSKDPETEKKEVELHFAELNRHLHEWEETSGSAGELSPPVIPEMQLRQTYALIGKMLQHTAALQSTVSDSGVSDSAEVKSSLVELESLEAALDVIADAVFILGEGGEILFCNQAALVLCGRPFVTVKGKPFEKLLMLVNEKTMEPCSNVREKLEQNRSGREHRCLFTSSDGRERVVIVKGELLRGHSGASLGTMLFIRDVTEKEILEEELLKVRKLESVGLLAGGIAHDFNNILTGIITNLFMARMSVVDNEEACQLIADAEKAAFKATRLTKQLLTFSQGGAPVKEVLNVDQLIEETVGFSLSGSNVDYRLQFAEDLRVIEADKGQIDQVLNNLVVNAAQAMPDGGTVFITAENITLRSDSADDPSIFNSTGVPLVDGEYVKISVRDEGPGIPRKHISRIFDPYFSTKTGSTGLGLTTAYSIISKHGGYIAVDSNPGKGTVFSCFLPAYIEEQVEEQQVEAAAEEHVGKVLVMDDDIIIRTVVEKLLRKTGYSVECVTNGADALEAYKIALEKNEPFEFVIMDLTIPGGMGGKETVIKLKEYHNNAKVVVFSGYSNDPILTNFREYGFDGVLKKPFSTDELMQLIATIGESPE